MIAKEDYYMSEVAGTGCALVLALIIVSGSVSYYEHARNIAFSESNPANCSIHSCECKMITCINQSGGYPAYYPCYDCKICIFPDISLLAYFTLNKTTNDGNLCKDYIKGAVAPCPEWEAKFKN